MYFVRLFILCSICISVQSTTIRPSNIEQNAAHQYGKQTEGIHGLIKKFGSFGGGRSGGSGSRGSGRSGSRGSRGRTGAGVGAGLGAGAAAGHRHRNGSSTLSNSASSSGLLSCDPFGMIVKITVALLLTLS